MKINRSERKNKWMQIHEKRRWVWQIVCVLSVFANVNCSTLCWFFSCHFVLSAWFVENQKYIHSHTNAILPVRICFLCRTMMVDEIVFVTHIIMSLFLVCILYSEMWTVSRSPEYHLFIDRNILNARTQNTLIHHTKSKSNREGNESKYFKNISLQEKRHVHNLLSSKVNWISQVQRRKWNDVNLFNCFCFIQFDSISNKRN